VATRFPLNLSIRPGTRLAIGGPDPREGAAVGLGAMTGTATAPPAPPPGVPAAGAPPGAPAPEAPPPPAPAPMMLSPAAIAALTGAVRPGIAIGPLLPDLRPLLPKTTTQLARSALNQLNAAPRELLDEALRTLQGKGVGAGQLMNYLERKVRIGEVLNELSDRWAAETVDDFANAFQMDRGRTAVMDLIVAVAVLNDPHLEGELLAENRPSTADGDLMQRRQVVWQHPAPGTPLEPPYIVLLAVDYRDIASAQEVVASILGQLVEARGYKIPREAAARLG
jgi:hypothetical protein